MDAMNDQGQSHSRHGQRPPAGFNISNVTNNTCVSISNSTCTLGFNQGKAPAMASETDANGGDGDDAADEVPGKKAAANLPKKKPPPGTPPENKAGRLPLIGYNVIPEKESGITMEHAMANYASRWVFLKNRHEHDEPWDNVGYPDKANQQEFMAELKQVRSEIQKESNRAGRNKVIDNFAKHRFQVDGDNVTKTDDIQKFIQSEGMKQLFLMCPRLPFIIIYDLVYRTSSPSEMNRWLPKHMVKWAKTKHTNQFDFVPSKSVPTEATAKEYAEAQAKKIEKAKRNPGKKGRNRSTRLVTNTIIKIAKTSARGILPSINQWQLDQFDMYLGFRYSDEDDTIANYHQIKVDLGLGKDKTQKTYLVAKKSKFPMLPEAPSYDDLCKDAYFAIQPCAEHAYRMARMAKDSGLDMDAALKSVTKAVKVVWGVKDTLPAPKVVNADSIDAAISSLGKEEGVVEEYAQRRLDEKNDQKVLARLTSKSSNNDCGAHPMMNFSHHHNQGTHPTELMPYHQGNGNGQHIRQALNHPQAWPGYYHHHSLQGLNHVPHSTHGGHLQTYLANGHAPPPSMNPPPEAATAAKLALPVNNTPHGKMNPPPEVATAPNLARPVNNAPHGKAGPEPKQKTLDERPCSPSIFDAEPILNENLSTPSASGHSGSSFTPLPYRKTDASTHQQEAISSRQKNDLRTSNAAVGPGGNAAAVIRLQRGKDPPKRLGWVTGPEDVVPKAASAESDRSDDDMTSGRGGMPEDVVPKAVSVDRSDDDMTSGRVGMPEDVVPKAVSAESGGNLGKHGEDDTANVGADDTSNGGEIGGEEKSDNLEVEELLEVAEDDDGEPIWLVKWKGHDESGNTWEPREHLDEESLTNADSMYERFLKEKEKIGEVEELLSIKEEDEYEKKKGRKRGKAAKIPKWLVKWKDCDESENSWEPRNHLDKASQIIADDMYTQFLKNKENNRKKQKESRDAIFSKRAKKAETPAGHSEGRGGQMQLKFSKPPESKSFYFCKNAPQRDNVCKAAMCTRCRDHLNLNNRHYRPVPEAVRAATEEAAREEGEAAKEKAPARSSGRDRKKGEEAAKEKAPARRSGRDRKTTGKTKTDPVYDVDCNGCSHDNPAFWQESDARRFYLETGRLSNNCNNCGHPV